MDLDSLVDYVYEPCTSRVRPRPQTVFLFDPLLAYGDLKGDFLNIQNWDELLEKLY